jgi:hypothetical protein
LQVEYKIEDDDDIPRRPTAIVDGRDGKVLMKWNSMTTYCAGQGTGGNEKVILRSVFFLNELFKNCTFKHLKRSFLDTCFCSVW